MTIREAHITDAPFIRRLLEQLQHPLAEESVIEKINHYKFKFYHLKVVEIDNKVIGFASLHWYDVFYAPGYVGRITAFCVDQQFRSRGIGSALLREIEIFFRKQGCIRIEVSSNERRIDAHRFYIANGYIVNSKRFIKQIVN